MHIETADLFLFHRHTLEVWLAKSLVTWYKCSKIKFHQNGGE